MSEFSFPNMPHRKRSCLFGPGEQILNQIQTICSQQDKFGNDIKTFRFRFQNDIRTFVLSFLTLLPGGHVSAGLLLAVERRRQGKIPWRQARGKRFPARFWCVTRGEVYRCGAWRGKIPEADSGRVKTASKNTKSRVADPHSFHPDPDPAF
jgi:hypothetical protein